ncbi:response regulator [Fangia hongkongensis]|uniref:response regulator n=1 Tax=Fangia hongkongensis TaxID=270495 RepID=UPI000370244F|nr:response regulator [Fangia hongkongensis]MBK2125871.1 response regulator [Fangia hongkongensis]
MKDRKIKPILLAEDDPCDADLTIRSLKENNILNTIDWVKDGTEVLDYLHYQGEYQNREKGMPELIILDIKMPKLNGLDVLKELKKSEPFRLLPVVMLTSSKEEQDLYEAYNLGINAYVVKPVDFSQFALAIKEIGAFWLLINEPPPLD